MPLKPGIRIIGRFAVFFIYTGIMVWLSLTSQLPKISVKLVSWDKFQHAAAYFFLTFFAGRAFLGLIVSHRKAWHLALIFSVLFGISMEIAQSYFTRVRTADMYDIAANISGALTIYTLACLIPQISGKPFHAENQISHQPGDNKDAP